MKHVSNHGFVALVCVLGISGQWALADGYDHLGGGRYNKKIVVVHSANDEAEAKSLWDRVRQNSISAKSGEDCSVYARASEDGIAVSFSKPQGQGYLQTDLTIPQGMLPLTEGKTFSRSLYGGALYVEKWIYQNGNLVYTGDSYDKPNHRSRKIITFYTNRGLTQINGFDYRTESHRQDSRGNYYSKAGVYDNVASFFSTASFGSYESPGVRQTWGCSGNPYQVKQMDR